MGTQTKASKATPKRKSIGAKASRPSNSKGKSLSSKKNKKATRQSIAVKPLEADVAWKSVFIQGEAIHTGAIARLHDGIEAVNGGRTQFDFAHLISTLKGLRKEYPKSSLFVFGGSPESFDFPSSENGLVKPGVHPVPIINVIIMPKGSQPPPFVAVNDFQSGTEEIKPFDHFSLCWKAPTWAKDALEGRVSVLACNKRMTTTAFKVQSEGELYQLEYASLFTAIPSKDFQVESYDDSKLSIRHTTFDYVGTDGEEITEEFDRDTDSLSTFVLDFLDRYDLDGSHEQGVKSAIKTAFEKARKQKQEKMDLLSGYDPEVLEGIEVVKLYPRNDFVAEHFKTTRVNGYYRHAVRLV